MKRALAAVSMILAILLGVWKLKAAYTYSYTENLASPNWSNWNNVYNNMEVQSFGGYSGVQATDNYIYSGWMWNTVSRFKGPPNWTNAYAGELKTVFRWDQQCSMSNNFKILLKAADVGFNSVYYTIDVTRAGNLQFAETDSSFAPVSILGAGQFPVTGGATTVRVVMVNQTMIVYVDNVQRLTTSFSGSYLIYFDWGIWNASPTFWDGNPGYVTCHNLLTDVAFGDLNVVAPNTILSSNISKAAYSNHVALQWPTPTDDANGTGVYSVELYRDGNLIMSGGTSFDDTAGIVPNHTYNYSLKVMDFHRNVSTTNFSVSTPNVQTQAPFPSVTPEGRRTGVRPTGAYWGADSENIDVMSGNLNFTLPMVAGQTRSGLSVGAALSYNSQNWRWDASSSSNWRFGRDIGYGWGWRLAPGSMVPVYSDPYTVSYWLFVDSTGAEYKLDQQSGGEWSSKESAYVYWLPATQRLYFRDGTMWAFDCISADGQPDQGVIYPTLIQDTNGNQIAISYKTAGPWANSSGRISTISDIQRPAGSTYTYNFTYNSDTPVPHLTSIASATLVKPQVSYTFAYTSSQSISSPYNSGSTVTTKLLQSVTRGGINRAESFTYNSSGELTQATLPTGGRIAYDYVTTTYSSGVKHREVQARKLYKDYTGGTYAQYSFAHESSPGASVHQWTQLTDPSNVGQKYWEFGQSGVSFGLVTKYEGRDLNAGVAKVRNDYTWTLDSASKNSYISEVLTTKDPGQTYQVRSKVGQDVDIYGNVTQVRTYDYEALSSPLRTDSYGYVNGSAYLARHIFDLPPVIRA